MPIRILLADDHAVVRQGLKMFLDLDPELVVVGEAQDGHEAVQRAHELKPDVVLMDILMPRMDGLEATRQIRAQLPGTEVLTLTSVLDDSSVVQAVRSGAIGYLLKDTKAEELCRAIHAAAAGKTQLSPEAAARLVREVCTEEPEVDFLTSREKEVLRQIVAGSSNKEIASNLKIAEKTVKTHVSNLLSKLNLQSRTQAALYAVSKGWFR